MYSYKVLVDSINDYAENNELFWVAGLAREAYPILKNHLDELHEVAQISVEHYVEEARVKGELRKMSKKELNEYFCQNTKHIKDDEVDYYEIETSDGYALDSIDTHELRKKFDKWANN
jgi:hypothetical protein